MLRMFGEVYEFKLVAKLCKRFGEGVCQNGAQQSGSKNKQDIDVYNGRNHIRDIYA